MQAPATAPPGAAPGPPDSAASDAPAPAPPTGVGPAPAPPAGVAGEISRRLVAALDPIALAVVNDSAHHGGHLGDDGSGETHFSVTVEALLFVGKSRVARQRLVNQALADLLPVPIHALAIRARAPGEPAA